MLYMCQTQRGIMCIGTQVKIDTPSAKIPMFLRCAKYIFIYRKIRYFFLLFIAIDTPNQLNPMQSCLITIIVFVI